MEEVDQKVLDLHKKQQLSLKLQFVIFGNINLLYLFSGREFGTSSLEIHLKSCKQKWENE